MKTRIYAAPAVKGLRGCQYPENPIRYTSAISDKISFFSLLSKFSEKNLVL